MDDRAEAAEGLTEDEKETLRKYGDIIDLPHPTSRTHPRMPAASRAAQFAPFAALTGLEGELEETARYTEEKQDLDENRREELDLRLQELQAALDGRSVSDDAQTPDRRLDPDDAQAPDRRLDPDDAQAPDRRPVSDDAQVSDRRQASGSGQVMARITYFSPDEKKEGGAYQTLQGAVRRIDHYRKSICMEDGTEIPAADIKDLEVIRTDS